MKVTILKRKGRTEVISRVDLAAPAQNIRDGKIDRVMKYHREIYHLMNPQRSCTSLTVVSVTD